MIFQYDPIYVGFTFLSVGVFDDGSQFCSEKPHDHLSKCLNKNDVLSPMAMKSGGLDFMMINIS